MNTNSALYSDRFFSAAEWLINCDKNLKNNSLNRLLVVLLAKQSLKLPINVDACTGLFDFHPSGILYMVYPVLFRSRFSWSSSIQERQGCSTLESLVGQQLVEVKGIIVEAQADMSDAVETQQVEKLYKTQLPYTISL